jgi:inner membrane protein
VNPLVHAELGWLAAQRLRARKDRVLVTLAGVAPDLDGLSLLAGQEAYARWHHVVAHGLPAALLLCGLLAWRAEDKRGTFLLGLVTFHLHLACDLAGSGDFALGGSGWPVLYLWPLSRAELSWSGQWDLVSWQNTLIGLGATLACLLTALRWNRTAVELFSTSADAAVVRAVRARFRR